MERREFIKIVCGFLGAWPLAAEAHDRRRLQSATEAVIDTQDLCARARRLVQESQELLRQVDDLNSMGPVLRKNKHH